MSSTGCRWATVSNCGNSKASTPATAIHPAITKALCRTVNLANAPSRELYSVEAALRAGLRLIRDAVAVVDGPSTTVAVADGPSTTVAVADGPSTRVAVINIFPRNETASTTTIT